MTRIGALANGPSPAGSEKLVGALNAWRVRQGDYRILFTIEDEARVIEVFKIGHAERCIENRFADSGCATSDKVGQSRIAEAKQ